MFNPVILNRKYLLTYAIVWVLLMAIHILLLMVFYNFPAGISISEGIVFNFLFSVIGLGLWFPVYFQNTRKGKIISFLLYHIMACIISVGLWLWVSYSILSLSFPDNSRYIAQLSASLPVRAGTGVLFYILIVLVYYLMIYYQNFKEKLTRESELKALVKESELNSLKSQINPHFLFNSLNSISSLTLISPERAREMVIKLSEFLRYSLSHSQEQLTSMKDELQNISRYLDIEKIRFGKRLVVHKNIDEKCLEQKLPGLILQPLIENAIKYGVYESTSTSSITIECKSKNMMLEVTLLNDFDPETVMKKGEGIGISNINKRMLIMYARDDLFFINKTDHTFEITLRFPQFDEQ